MTAPVERWEQELRALIEHWRSEEQMTDSEADEWLHQVNGLDAAEMAAEQLEAVVNELVQEASNNDIATVRKFLDRAETPFGITADEVQEARDALSRLIGRPDGESS